MRKDKLRAYELRREGKSYKKINRLLNIPLSTLASWFKDVDWSRQIRDELGTKASFLSPEKLAAIQKANKNRWAKKYAEYRSLAESEFASRKNRPTFIAGIMLYWGQGNKSLNDSHVKLANNDPMMIRVFCNFLTEELGVALNKVAINLLLYPDLNDEMQKKQWSRSIGIQLSQFKKSSFITDKQSKRRLSYGVCNVRVSSRELKEKLLVWINLFQKDLA